jgi:hypothetical protein
MITTNIPTGAQRIEQVGLCWEEVLTNAAGTLEVREYSTFRVRAGSGPVTVTVNGRLAMTLAANEVERFNTGDRNPTSGKPTVTVVISGNAYVQIARNTEYRRQQPNP